MHLSSLLLRKKDFSSKVLNFNLHVHQKEKKIRKKINTRLGTKLCGLVYEKHKQRIGYEIMWVNL